MPVDARKSSPSDYSFVTEAIFPEKLLELQAPQGLSTATPLQYIKNLPSLAEEPPPFGNSAAMSRRMIPRYQHSGLPNIRSVEDQV